MEGLKADTETDVSTTNIPDLEADNKQLRGLLTSIQQKQQMTSLEVCIIYHVSSYWSYGVDFGCKSHRVLCKWMILLCVILSRSLCTEYVVYDFAEWSKLFDAKEKY